MLCFNDRSSDYKPEYNVVYIEKKIKKKWFIYCIDDTIETSSTNNLIEYTII